MECLIKYIYNAAYSTRETRNIGLTLWGKDTRPMTHAMYRPMMYNSESITRGVQHKRQPKIIFEASK